ncbi:MAG TPA: septal ring lytic transglycosylase RlpA family protein, partial [Verrucomicrobiae bacterium]
MIVLTALSNPALGEEAISIGLASWYGEEHRGGLMANGQPFNPDEFTAASWFYPLGTRVRVTIASEPGTTNSVEVTVTDRGPARQLVRERGRVIDLSLSAFKTLGSPDLGL